MPRLQQQSSPHLPLYIRSLILRVALSPEQPCRCLCKRRAFVLCVCVCVRVFLAEPCVIRVQVCVRAQSQRERACALLLYAMSGSGGIKALLQAAYFIEQNEKLPQAGGGTGVVGVGVALPQQLPQQPTLHCSLTNGKTISIINNNNNTINNNSTSQLNRNSSSNGIIAATPSLTNGNASGSASASNGIGVGIFGNVNGLSNGHCNARSALAGGGVAEEYVVGGSAATNGHSEGRSIIAGKSLKRPQKYDSFKNHTLSKSCKSIFFNKDDFLNSYLKNKSIFQVLIKKLIRIIFISSNNLKSIKKRTVIELYIFKFKN